MAGDAGSTPPRGGRPHLRPESSPESVGEIRDLSFNVPLSRTNRPPSESPNGQGEARDAAARGHPRSSSRPQKSPEPDRTGAPRAPIVRSEQGSGRPRNHSARQASERTHAGERGSRHHSYSTGHRSPSVKSPDRMHGSNRHPSRNASTGKRSTSPHHGSYRGGDHARSPSHPSNHDEGDRGRDRDHGRRRMTDREYEDSHHRRRDRDRDHNWERREPHPRDFPRESDTWDRGRGAPDRPRDRNMPRWPQHAERDRPHPGRGGDRGLRDRPPWEGGRWDRAPPHDMRGQPYDGRGPPQFGPRGTVPDGRAPPPFDARGPPPDGRAPSYEHRGPPFEGRGPPHDARPYHDGRNAGGGFIDDRGRGPIRDHRDGDRKRSGDEPRGGDRRDPQRRDGRNSRDVQDVRDGQRGSGEVRRSEGLPGDGGAAGRKPRDYDRSDHGTTREGGFDDGGRKRRRDSNDGDHGTASPPALKRRDGLEGSSRGQLGGDLPGDVRRSHAEGEVEGAKIDPAGRHGGGTKELKKGIAAEPEDDMSTDVAAMQARAARAAEQERLARRKGAALGSAPPQLAPPPSPPRSAPPPAALPDAMQVVPGLGSGGLAGSRSYDDPGEGDRQADTYGGWQSEGHHMPPYQCAPLCSTPHLPMHHDATTFKVFLRRYPNADLWHQGAPPYGGSETQPRMRPPPPPQDPPQHSPPALHTPAPPPYPPLPESGPDPYSAHPPPLPGEFLRTGSHSDQPPVPPSPPSQPPREPRFIAPGSEIPELHPIRKAAQVGQQVQEVMKGVLMAFEPPGSCPDPALPPTSASWAQRYSAGDSLVAHFASYCGIDLRNPAVFARHGNHDSVEHAFRSYWEKAIGETSRHREYGFEETEVPPFVHSWRSSPSQAQPTFLMPGSPPEMPPPSSSPAVVQAPTPSEPPPAPELQFQVPQAASPDAAMEMADGVQHDASRDPRRAADAAQKHRKPGQQSMRDSGLQPLPRDALPEWMAQVYPLQLTSYRKHQGIPSAASPSAGSGALPRLSAATSAELDVFRPVVPQRVSSLKREPSIAVSLPEPSDVAVALQDVPELLVCRSTAASDGPDAAPAPAAPLRPGTLLRNEHGSLKLCAGTASTTNVDKNLRSGAAVAFMRADMVSAEELQARLAAKCEELRSRVASAAGEAGPGVTGDAHESAADASAEDQKPAMLQGLLADSVQWSLAFRKQDMARVEADLAAVLAQRAQHDSGAVCATDGAGGAPPNGVAASAPAAQPDGTGVEDGAVEDGEAGKQREEKQEGMQNGEEEEGVMDVPMADATAEEDGEVDDNVDSTAKVDAALAKLVASAMEAVVAAAAAAEPADGDKEDDGATEQDIEVLEGRLEDRVRRYTRDPLCKEWGKELEKARKRHPLRSGRFVALGGEHKVELMPVVEPRPAPQLQTALGLALVEDYFRNDRKNIGQVVKAIKNRISEFKGLEQTDPEKYKSIKAEYDQLSEKRAPAAPAPGAVARARPASQSGFSGARPEGPVAQRLHASGGPAALQASAPAVDEGPAQWFHPQAAKPQKERFRPDGMGSLNGGRGGARPMVHRGGILKPGAPMKRPVPRGPGTNDPGGPNGSGGGRGGQRSRNAGPSPARGRMPMRRN